MSASTNPSGASRWFFGVVGALVAIGAWELAGRLGTLGLTWPPLTRVIETLVDQRDLLARALRASLPPIVKGFALGISFGTLMSVITQLLPRQRGFVTQFATILNAMPLVVLAPVTVTMFSQDAVEVLISAMASYFPMFIATTAAFSAARSSLLDVMKCYGAGRFTTFLRVRVPAAIPGIADGLRLAAPGAVLGALFGEWFGADPGLGNLLASSMLNFQIGLLWSAALIATALSVTALLVFTALGRWAQWEFA